MNLADLQKKLIAAARQHPPDDRVPYAFEKRILAGLDTASPPDAWALWGRALWGGAVVCTALALLAGALSVSAFRPGPTDLAQDFEQTIMASAEDVDSGW